MSASMRNARDILVAGIGFLLGMVFCYFLTAPKPATTIGGAAVNQGRTLPILQASVSAVLQTGHVRQVILSPGTFETLDPNSWIRPNGTWPRIVPARSGAIEGPGVQHYDLIDLNYTPDFEIDLK